MSMWTSVWEAPTATGTNRIGCNQNNAPHVSKLEDGWYERITAELEAGFQWPELVPVEPLDAMGGDVLAARRQEAMLADLAAKMPGVPQVEQEYSAAVTARQRVDPDDDGIVFAVDSPFARARELKEEYEVMEPHALVDRGIVDGQLTSIGQYSLGNKDADDEVEGMVRLWHLSVNPDVQRLQGKPLTAGYAASLFSVAYQWCGEFEEALLLSQAGIDADTDEVPARVCWNSSEAALMRKHILQAIQWRKWSEAHDGTRPKQTGYLDGVQSQEAKLAEAMRTWRSPSRGGLRRRHQSWYLLLLRHHNWFAPYVRGQKASSGGPQQTAKDVNHHLQLGFGFRAMVEAGLADRVFPSCCDVCGGGNRVYMNADAFLRGANAELADVFLAVGGKLTAARAAAVRAIHEGNVDTRKATAEVSSAKRKAVREENGRSKKQKVEAGPSAEGELASESE